MAEHHEVGWYQDPSDSRRHRYWDGTAWLSQEEMAPSTEAADAASEPVVS